MFAYTFSASPPFGMRSVSREFRMQLPGALQPPGMQPPGMQPPGMPVASSSTTSSSLQPPRRGASRPMTDVDPSLLWPPPPVRAVHARLRGADGKPQFPVGLSWATTSSSGGGAATIAGRCVMLSWGHDDVETYVSVVPLGTLLSPAMTTVL